MDEKIPATSDSGMGQNAPERRADTRREDLVRGATVAAT
jgi:hypothetical protein